MNTMENWKELLNAIPEEKAKELLKALAGAVDVKELVKKAEGFGIRLDEAQAKTLLEKCKGVAALGDKELGKVVGGVLGSIRPGGNASGKDFIG